MRPDTTTPRNARPNPAFRGATEGRDRPAKTVFFGDSNEWRSRRDRLAMPVIPALPLTLRIATRPVFATRGPFAHRRSNHAESRSSRADRGDRAADASSASVGGFHSPPWRCRRKWAVRNGLPSCHRSVRGSQLSLALAPIRPFADVNRQSSIVSRGSSVAGRSEPRIEWW